MRMSIVVDQKGITHSNLYLHLTNIKKFCLFDFQFKKPELKEVFPKRFWELVQEVNAAINSSCDLCYIYAMCDFTNTITLCPPILDMDKGLVIYDKSKYEEKLNRDMMPCITIDMEEFYGFTAYNPNSMKVIADSVKGQKQVN